MITRIPSPFARIVSSWVTSLGKPTTLLAVFLSTLAAAEPLLEKSEVFPPGVDGIARYRIPGIVVTTKGTVLAYAEARRNGAADWGEIEIHLRRSTDGGKTWQLAKHIAHMGDRIEGNPHKKAGGEKEQTVNNPVAIVDRVTGSIEFLYCVNYARCFSMRSTDDGLTWSAPVEITAAFEPLRKHYDWKVIATGPGHGIQLKSGRLVARSGSPTANRAHTGLLLPRRSSAMITARPGRRATSPCRTPVTSTVPTKPCWPPCRTEA